MGEIEMAEAATSTGSVTYPRQQHGNCIARARFAGVFASFPPCSGPLSAMGYSYRRASMGSTSMARRAGM